MDKNRYVEIFSQFPERSRRIIVRIDALVVRVDEETAQTQLANGTFGLLDHCRARRRQDRREAQHFAGMFGLQLGRVIRPALHRLEFVSFAFVANIVSGIADHAECHT